MLKTVSQGRFRITVNEKGYLDSQRNETLTCQVPGSTTIINIVPEGSIVQKGDIVCELDSSSIEEKARQQEIDVTKAEAALSAAKENLEIQKNQNASDIAIAALTLELAQLDHDKYINGELPQERDTILGQIRLKEEELARKRESYDFTKRMAKKGYRSLSELEAERIAVTQAEINLKVEKDKLRVLEDYTSKRNIAQLEADATELERELERTRRKAEAALSKAEAEFESSKLTLQVEKEKYQEWLSQIANCTLRAPQGGEVVYANQRSSRRGNDEPDIIEGATVRERQAIINIPDNTLMKIDARIHESMISKLKTAQPVLIRCDAQPGEVFQGTVAEISSVPMSGSFPNYDIKEYQVAINLTETPERVSALRPGLSADFEIVVEDRSNVLQAPMQSIVQIGRQYYAWVVQGTSLSRRQVSIGMSNDTDIEILDGIQVGEKVVMNPRSQFGDEIKDLEETISIARADGDDEFEFGGDSNKSAEESPRGNGGKRPGSAGPGAGGPGAGGPGAGRPAAGGPGGPKGPNGGKPSGDGPPKGKPGQSRPTA